MSGDKKNPDKPIQLTQDAKIDIQTLAAALRLAVDPIETAKVHRLQDVEGKPQVRIAAVSHTGARFTVVIEEGRNVRTRQLEQVIKTLEDYEYPWSPELENCAGNYNPPLRFWKNPNPDAMGSERMPYDWGTTYDDRGVAHRKPIDQVVHPQTGQLNRDCKQKLYDDTWKADLRTYVGLTVAQGTLQGLREVKKAG